MKQLLATFVMGFVIGAVIALIVWQETKGWF